MQSSQLDERNDFFPESQRTLQNRRKLVISLCISYVIALIAFLLIPFLAPTHVDWARFFFYGLTLIATLSCGISYALLAASTRNIAQKPDHQLDERRRLLRDRAYRLSYRIVSVFLLISLANYMFLRPLILSLEIDALSFLYSFSLPGVVLFFSTLLLVAALPTMIIAW
jgi:hypothetical protein